MPAKPPADLPVPDPTPAPEPAVNWRYDGPQPERVYTNVPATVARGDVIAWPELPADDGCWTPTTDPVTRHPDSHRPEPAPQPAPQEG